MFAILKVARYFAFGIGVPLVLYAIYNYFEVNRSQQVLDDKLQVLKAEGQPVSVQELHDQAARLNRPESVWQVLQPIQPRLTELVTQLRPVLREKPSPWFLNSAQQDLVVQTMSQYSDVLAALETAGLAVSTPEPIQATTADAFIDETLGTNDLLGPSNEFGILNQFGTADTYRDLFRQLALYGGSLATQDRTEEATQLAITMLRLIRQLEFRPGSNQFRTAVECRLSAVQLCNGLIRQSPLTPEQLAALNAELALHDTNQPLLRAIKADRAFYLSLFAETQGWGKYWFFRARSNREAARLIGNFDTVLATAVLSNLQDQSLPIPSKHAEYAAADSIFVEMGTLQNYAAHSLAYIRCLQALIAIKSAGLLDTDSIDLNTLGLSERTLTDPFNGQQLQIHVSRSGTVIYTTGGDFVSNGGWIRKDPQDVGIGPILDTTDDAEFMIRIDPVPASTVD